MKLCPLAVETGHNKKRLHRVIPPVQAFARLGC